MNILILMAGSDKDFCEKGYPKYLIEIKNKPIIQRTIELLKTVGNNITCIIRKEDQDKYFLGDTLKILCPKCKKNIFKAKISSVKSGYSKQCNECRAKEI